MGRVASVALIASACLALASCSGRYAEAERAVRAQLNDPDSAKFYEEEPCEKVGVTGLVNSKNAYGGYAGNRTFFYVNGRVYLEDGDFEGGYMACHGRSLSDDANAATANAL